VALSWGQDRVDERSLPLSGTYTPDRTGNGATVWVVGSGVDVTIAQLSGRVSNPFTVESPPYDCHGSGTKAAVTAAGSSYGIASAAIVRGIKVLGCGGGGSSGNLVDGLSYVLANLAARNVVLVTASYTGRNSAVESVIADLIAADATVVAPAGDQGTNACNFFPASQSGVISVASTTPSDSRYSFSNYGSCVTMFAPGRDITTQTLGGTVVNSTGTVLAAAEVAGAATMVLQSNPSWTGAQVLNNLLNRATQDVISSAKSTPNLLLFVLQNSNPPQPTTSTTTSTTSSPAAAAGASLALLLLVLGIV
jgi:serine protease